MFIINVNEKEAAEVTEPGAEKVKIRWLIHKGIGAQKFHLRHFIVEPGGHTPLHAHPADHEVYILNGKGLVRGGEREVEVKPGDAIFIPENELHQFKNVGEEPLVFLCVKGEEPPIKKPLREL
jgi:quercetin dioxygenase-like cupin family protein